MSPLTVCGVTTLLCPLCQPHASTTSGAPLCLGGGSQLLPSRVGRLRAEAVREAQVITLHSKEGVGSDRPCPVQEVSWRTYRVDAYENDHLYYSFCLAAQIHHYILHPPPPPTLV